MIISNGCVVICQFMSITLDHALYFIFSLILHQKLSLTLFLFKSTHIYNVLTYILWIHTACPLSCLTVTHNCLIRHTDQLGHQSCLIVVNNLLILINYIEITLFRVELYALPWVSLVLECWNEFIAFEFWRRYHIIIICKLFVLLVQRQGIVVKVGCCSICW